MHRRTFVKAAIASAALPVFASPVHAGGAGLAAILRRHVLARGGSAAIDAVTGMRAELRITEKGSTVAGHYAALRTPTVTVRIDVFAEKERVWSEGLDAQGCWIQPGKAAKPIASAKGEPAFRHGVVFNLYGIEHIPALGGRLESGGRQTIQGVRYHMIRVTLADGFATQLYLDPDSFLLARRRDVRPLHPDLDMTSKPFENEFSDYRSVEGVQTPFASAQTDLTTGKIVQTTKFVSIAYNPAPDIALLQRGSAPL